MDENTADTRIVNDLDGLVCCTSEGADVDFDVIMPCPATGDVSVMTTSTEETDTTTEKGDDEETTTTTSSGGGADDSSPDVKQQSSLEVVTTLTLTSPAVA